MQTLICEHCGSEFSASTKRRFCGRACANKARGVKATSWTTYRCEACGIEVTTKPRYVGKYRYCKACRDRLHGERLNADRKERVVKVCAHCGKSFTVLPCFSARQFCSRDCFAASKIGKPHPQPRPAMSDEERLQRNREKTERHRRQKQAEWDAMPKIACACGCGTLIAPIGRQGKPVQYAQGHNPQDPEKWSHKGKPSWNKGISGKDSHSWINGCSTLPYGPEFTKRYKRLIRERDNYTCQRCGKTQAEDGHTLQIHHIDHNKMNNDPTNLVTVCGTCNVWASRHRDEPFVRFTS